MKLEDTPGNEDPRAPAEPPPPAQIGEGVPEDRRPLKMRSTAWAQRLARNIAARGFAPNQISLAGVAFALLGFVMLWGVGRWPVGWIFLIPAAVCIQARLLCNLLDGMIAVEGGRKEKGGELFNEVPDRIEDTLFLVGAGYAAVTVELGWLCAVLAVFTAYIRALGVSLGQSPDFGGPCAMPQRMAILTLALIVAQVLVFVVPDFRTTIYWGLVLIAVSTAVTAALRLRRIYLRMRA